MTTKKDISIVIPTAFENGEYLQQTLATIHKHTEQSFEIIVVLNGEQPMSKGLAELYGAKIVQLPENMGFGHAMNAGFE
jgi:glycosyltransferase involved in cell wall biosynthesis